MRQWLPCSLTEATALSQARCQLYLRPGFSLEPARVHHTGVRSRIATAGFGDQLLDYIEGGPKLRRWYGQGERPTDGSGWPNKESSDQKRQSPADVPRDAVLVTDAESPTGQAVVLQLILARQKVRTLVNNAETAAKEYGPYVVPVSGDVMRASAVREALVGVRAIVVAGRLGPHLLSAAKAAQVEHIIVPSLAGSNNNPLAFWNPDTSLRESNREADASAAEVPITIVRARTVTDRPGGGCQLSFNIINDTPGGSSDNRPTKVHNAQEISRQDLAEVIVSALEHPPPAKIAFAVAAAGPGRNDWHDELSSLLTPKA